MSDLEKDIEFIAKLLHTRDTGASSDWNLCVDHVKEEYLANAKVIIAEVEQLIIQRGSQ